MESKELVPVADVRGLAESIVKSKLFGEYKDPEAAFAMMMLCQAEGLHPMQAVRRYHIIQGRPAMKADAMLAEFQTRGGKVKWLRCDDTEVSAEFTAPGVEGNASVSWTFERAKKAGLTSKQTWTQYPRQMLRARVISEGVRMAMPAVVVGLYTPEEVQDYAKEEVTYTPPPKAEKPSSPPSGPRLVTSDAPPAPASDEPPAQTTGHPMVEKARATFGLAAPAKDEARAKRVVQLMIGTRPQGLGWAKPHAANWLLSLFGTKDPFALDGKQQITAENLLTARRDDGEDTYNAMVEQYRVEKLVLPEKAK